ncbi:hypothetical protein GCM10009681_49050 [Luedemannella helvata]|uniref:Uncharacterized protein n=1 Tax=Luedemannella helvata TaxID=349315 RepID=A0ABP4X9J6_9ACTN
MTTEDVGGRLVTTEEVGGRLVTTEDVGGRLVTTEEVGGRLVTTEEVGGRLVTTEDVGGRLVTTEEVGVLPPQVTPFTANEVGLLLVPFQLARKPGFTEPPLPTAPFQLSFAKVTLDPVWVARPFQPCWIDWPFANENVSDQLVQASPVFLMTMLPWKPPCHEFTTEYVTLQEVAALAGEASATAVVPTATVAAAIATAFARRDRIGTNLMPLTPTVSGITRADAPVRHHGSRRCRVAPLARNLT